MIFRVPQAQFRQLCLFCLFVLISSASQAQILKGQVLDHANKQPLIGATILLRPTERVIQTDQNGIFKFADLDEGRYSISISYVGYEATSVKELLVISGKEKYTRIELQESINYLEEAVVGPQKEYGEAGNKLATVSGKAFTVEQSKRYAAAWGDPARMAQSFAGVTNNDDQSNEIIIRGNSPKGLLWRIEGIEVSNPNHFSVDGASGGGFGGISTNILANSDFYTGAFPAEYGNATSGVFDISLRSGNADRQEYSFQVGLQGMEASAEGPLNKKKNSSYLINYRIFTLGIFDKIGLNPAGETATPFFQDIAFKFHFQNKKTATSVWGVGGNSNSKFNGSTSSTVIDIASFFASGIKLTSYLNKKSFWENSFSVSGNTQNNQFLFNSFKQKTKNNYVNFRYSSQYNLKISPKISLRSGFILSRLGYDIVDEQEGGSYKFSRYDAQGAGYQSQAYIQWKWRLNNSVEITSGLHHSYLLLNNTSSLEPRLGGKWQFTSKSSFSFGIGRHSRIHPIPLYNANFTLNDTLSFRNNLLEIPKANHFILGYKFRPSTSWAFIIEAYYQQLYDNAIAVNADNDFFATYSSLNEMNTNIPLLLNSDGVGQNKGVELTAEHYLTKGFYLLNTTSIFQSTYKGADGITRQSRFSTGFVQNFLVGKEWILGTKNTHILGINFRTTWAGGLRSTPILLDESLNRGSVVEDYTNAFAQKLPNFFRTDFRVSLIRNKKGLSSTFSIDLNNFTNRRNPLGQIIDFEQQNIRLINQLGIIPVLTYRIDF